jgi:hypothetical protein
MQIATMIAGLLAARCADHDETVRRASLQQLTSLRIPSLVDVMLPPIDKLLDDKSPAVRAASVLAVLKVATLADAELNLDRLWERVDKMLHVDESCEVVHACVALKLQREDERTVVKDRQLIEDLMIRLGVRLLDQCFVDPNLSHRWRAVVPVAMPMSCCCCSSQQPAAEGGALYAGLE